MKRPYVLLAIEEERDYQDSRWQSDSDSTHSVADWLLFVEAHLNAAKGKIYNLDEEGAKDEVRKIAALCVAMGENLGMPERSAEKVSE